MAESVGNHTQLLEAAVKARTEQLERIANVDPLTEVWNRRGFLGAFERERNRAGRAEAQLGLLLIDMDNFKTINDAFGHHGGDAALAEAARRLTGIMRNYDACGRWGGDEFIMLVADCDAEVLAAVARRIVAAVTEASIRLGDGEDVRMTISVGACLIAAGRDVRRGRRQGRRGALRGQARRARSGRGLRSRAARRRQGRAARLELRHGRAWPFELFTAS